eukprot:354160-Alexandrium_andersonii.AAC.1
MAGDLPVPLRDWRNEVHANSGLASWGCCELRGQQRFAGALEALAGPRQRVRHQGGARAVPRPGHGRRR